MPAIRWDLTVEAGSYEPQYIVVSDPDTGDPLDLTQPGYLVHGVIASRSDGRGQVLVDLPEASGVWRRTPDGRLYFEPPSTVTAGWAFPHGHLHVELTHPSGETVRVASGLVRMSPELVT